MSFQIFKQAQAIAACVGLLASLFSASAAWGHGGSHGSGTKQRASAPAVKKNSNGYRSTNNPKLDPQELQTLYGGQAAATKWHFFEIVYAPQEIRIYVYSPSGRPINASRIRGKAVMQVNGNSKLFRYPIKQASDSQGRIYGSVVVNVTRVRDGDMFVTFELERLPFNEEKKAQFSQTFFLTRPPIPVTVVQLVKADRPLAELQRDCPVTDTGLSDHGQPIKLMVGNQSLFVCCEGCIENVKKNPQRFLQKAAAMVQANRQPARPHVAVFWASQNDEAAIRAQRNCPVMDQRLGAHGKPLKVVIDGQPIFVCCEGCIDKVVQDRDTYFRKVANVAERQQAAPPRNEQSPLKRRVIVSRATKEDRSAIQSQGVCPVMNQPLGGHGNPIKITIDGQPVFVCCKGCIKKVERNPDLYLSKVFRGKQANR